MFRVGHHGVSAARALLARVPPGTPSPHTNSRAFIYSPGPFRRTASGFSASYTATARAAVEPPSPAPLPPISGRRSFASPAGGSSVHVPSELDPRHRRATAQPAAAGNHNLVTHSEPLRLHAAAVGAAAEGNVSPAGAARLFYMPDASSSRSYGRVVSELEAADAAVPILTLEPTAAHASLSPLTGQPAQQRSHLHLHHMAPRAAASSLHAYAHGATPLPPSAHPIRVPTGRSTAAAPLPYPGSLAGAALTRRAAGTGILGGMNPQRRFASSPAGRGRGRGAGAGAGTTPAAPVQAASATAAGRLAHAPIKATAATSRQRRAQRQRQKRAAATAALLARAVRVAAAKVRAPAARPHAQRSRLPEASISRTAAPHVAAAAVPGPQAPMQGMRAPRVPAPLGAAYVVAPLALTRLLSLAPDTEDLRERARSDAAAAFHRPRAATTPRARAEELGLVPPLAPAADSGDAAAAEGRAGLDERDSQGRVAVGWALRTALVAHPDSQALQPSPDADTRARRAEFIGTVREPLPRPKPANTAVEADASLRAIAAGRATAAAAGTAVAGGTTQALRPPAGASLRARTLHAARGAGALSRLGGPRVTRGAATVTGGQAPLAPLWAEQARRDEFGARRREREWAQRARALARVDTPPGPRAMSWATAAAERDAERRVAAVPVQSAAAWQLQRTAAVTTGRASAQTLGAGISANVAATATSAKVGAGLDSVLPVAEDSWFMSVPAQAPAARRRVGTQMDVTASWETELEIDTEAGAVAAAEAEAEAEAEASDLRFSPLSWAAAAEPPVIGPEVHLRRGASPLQQQREQGRTGPTAGTQQARPRTSTGVGVGGTGSGAQRSFSTLGSNGAGLGQRRTSPAAVKATAAAVLTLVRRGAPPYGGARGSRRSSNSGSSSSGVSGGGRATDADLTWLLRNEPFAPDGAGGVRARAPMAEDGGAAAGFTARRPTPPRPIFRRPLYTSNVTSADTGPRETEAAVRPGESVGEEEDAWELPWHQAVHARASPRPRPAFAQAQTPAQAQTHSELRPVATAVRAATQQHQQQHRFGPAAVAAKTTDADAAASIQARFGERGKSTDRRDNAAADAIAAPEEDIEFGLDPASMQRVAAAAMATEAEEATAAATATDADATADVIAAPSPPQPSGPPLPDYLAAPADARGCGLTFDAAREDSETLSRAYAAAAGDPERQRVQRAQGLRWRLHARLGPTAMTQVQQSDAAVPLPAADMQTEGEANFAAAASLTQRLRRLRGRFQRMSAPGALSRSRSNALAAARRLQLLRAAAATDTTTGTDLQGQQDQQQDSVPSAARRPAGAWPGIAVLCTTLSGHRHGHGRGGTGRSGLLLRRADPPALARPRGDGSLRSSTAATVFARAALRPFTLAGSGGSLGTPGAVTGALVQRAAQARADRARQQADAQAMARARVGRQRRTTPVLPPSLLRASTPARAGIATSVGTGYWSCKSDDDDDGGDGRAGNAGGAGGNAGGAGFGAVSGAGHGGGLSGARGSSHGDSHHDAHAGASASATATTTVGTGGGRQRWYAEDPSWLHGGFRTSNIVGMTAVAAAAEAEAEAQPSVLQSLFSAAGLLPGMLPSTAGDSDRGVDSAGIVVGGDESGVDVWSWARACGVRPAQHWSSRISSAPSPAHAAAAAAAAEISGHDAGPREGYDHVPMAEFDTHGRFLGAEEPGGQYRNSALGDEFDGAAVAPWVAWPGGSTLSPSLGSKAGEADEAAAATAEAVRTAAASGRSDKDGEQKKQQKHHGARV